MDEDANREEEIKSRWDLNHTYFCTSEDHFSVPISSVVKKIPYWKKV